MKITELLQQREFIFFDGGMGTQLQAKGLEAGETPELLNITAPQMIKEIHAEYLAAGADIISANTFGANRHKLARCGKTPAELIPAAISIAKAAIAESGKTAYCALDIGPIGQLLEPAGTLSFEEAYDIFAEQVKIAEQAGADLLIAETFSDLYELKCAILAAKENSTLPLICSMSYEENGRTFEGCPPEAQILLCEGLGVDALGVNCSLGPDDLVPVIERLCGRSKIPVIVQPNAGLPDPMTGKYNVSSKDFAASMVKAVEMGARILGGCCGTTPEYIAELVKAVSGKQHVEREIAPYSAVCSGTSVCEIDQPRIIGERLNPTGKKLLKQALKDGDMGYILNQAVEQISAGADILDVNVGLPDIDEKSVMVSVIKALQGVCVLPLQIDSPDPEVLEAALRIYNGKPIVNSVNGEEKSLYAVLPKVKKYGAAVIGLTLDENGIPKKAEQRFAIAKRIVDRATAVGIPKEDIIIDCLTLTASAEQAAANETLKAVKMVKEQLGVKTVLGVSNISFGLPKRELVNHIFLSMALENGLDLAIINPNSELMSGTVRAFKLLKNIDVNCTEYIEAYANDTPAQPQTAADSMTLEYAIAKGLKDTAAKLTEQLVATTEPMEIINTRLIPALDKTGTEFEQGKIFLPQLILSAAAASGCFDVIKRELSKAGSGISKGKIVLATVKGDIHDIGKNIVKVLLENYGYTVIDLGKDVDYEAVVDAAIKHDVKLVGLSALMTTTLKSMEETIKLLKARKPDCKVVVGGAVLTEDYAMKIGADYYSKDAKQTVDIAKQIIG
ncbi:MAG: homocysteine S-methyltransferase family protein [Eubacterium sp.]|nr:homocysteine S-methyltransferase family protein [Eubacterium sp.]